MIELDLHPWLASALGGAMIGLSAVGMMAGLGRVAGISGIAASLINGTADRTWRLCFLLGLVVAAPLLWLASGERFGVGLPVLGLPWMGVAGVLVGFGTGLGSGCTSGHGVCGIARLSPRSLAATITFMLAGMLTVGVIRHLLGQP